jgi:hypothetical protein
VKAATLLFIQLTQLLSPVFKVAAMAAALSSPTAAAITPTAPAAQQHTSHVNAPMNSRCMRPWQQQHASNEVHDTVMVRFQ